MRAPLSKLAKQVLDNPDSARQLVDWLDSNQKSTNITLTNGAGQVKHLIATRLNTTVATHGEAYKKKALV